VCRTTEAPGVDPASRSTSDPWGTSAHPQSGRSVRRRPRRPRPRHVQQQESERVISVRLLGELRVGHQRAELVREHEQLLGEGCDVKRNVWLDWFSSWLASLPRSLMRSIH
jgi:hypothetical protein